MMQYAACSRSHQRPRRRAHGDFCLCVRRLWRGGRVLSLATSSSTKDWRYGLATARTSSSATRMVTSVGRLTSERMCLLYPPAVLLQRRD
jgi:hypothetical protein